MGHFIFGAEHETLRVEIRRFVERELAPHADEWEAAEFFPDTVFRSMGQLGGPIGTWWSPGPAMMPGAG